MNAGEIAELADVDLEHFGFGMPKGQSVLGKLPREIVIGG
jgi:hypothetical protein